MASIESPVSSFGRSSTGRGSPCEVGVSEVRVEMGVPTYIEDVEMVWSLLVAYHGSVIQVILRECYNAMGAKAEFHISMGGVVAKETFQNCFAVDRNVEEATEGDMIFARSLICLLQVCTDEVTVTLEFQAVYS